MVKNGDHTPLRSNEHDICIHADKLQNCLQYKDCKLLLVYRIEYRYCQVSIFIEVKISGSFISSDVFRNIDQFSFEVG